MINRQEHLLITKEWTPNNCSAQRRASHLCSFNRPFVAGEVQRFGWTILPQVLGLRHFGSWSHVLSRQVSPSLVKESTACSWDRSALLISYRGLKSLLHVTGDKDSTEPTKMMWNAAIGLSIFFSHKRRDGSRPNATKCVVPCLFEPFGGNARPTGEWHALIESVSTSFL